LLNLLINPKCGVLLPELLQIFPRSFIHRLAYPLDSDRDNTTRILRTETTIDRTTLLTQVLKCI
jgi:hypothetical protein